MGSIITSCHAVSGTSSSELPYEGQELCDQVTFKEIFFNISSKKIALLDYRISELHLALAG